MVWERAKRPTPTVKLGVSDLGEGRLTLPSRWEPEVRKSNEASVIRPVRAGDHISRHPDPGQGEVIFETTRLLGAEFRQGADRFD